MRPRATVVAALLAATVVSTWVTAWTALPALAAEIAPGQPAATTPGTGEPTPEAPVTVLLDDLPVAFPIPPFLDGDTTMVPLRALSEALGFRIVWKGEAGPIGCVKGDVDIAVRLGEREVTVNGRPAPMPRPAYLKGDTTVVPLRFFSETLGFDVLWDSDTNTANVRSTKSPLEVWSFYALGSQTHSSWEDLFGQKYPFPLTPVPSAPASKMTGAILGWFAVSSEGLIMAQGHPSGYEKPEGWEAVLMKLSLFGSKKVAMFFAENQGGKLSSLLADQGGRERLAVNVSLASVGFDGVALDFEGLGIDPVTCEKDAASFSAFVESVKRYCQNRLILTVLPPLNGTSRGYDHKRLGEVSDAVILMAYGYEDPMSPSPTAPWDKVDEAIRLETKEVPNDKLILGVPAYGTVYSQFQEVACLEARPAARDLVGPADSKPVFNPASASEVIAWREQEESYKAYLESNKTLQARISLAKRYGLRGVAIWRLGLLQQGWWDAVVQVVEPKR
jgi:hypothetical protein